MALIEIESCIYCKDFLPTMTVTPHIDMCNHSSGKGKRVSDRMIIPEWCPRRPQCNCDKCTGLGIEKYYEEEI